jgi:4-amino-4-deoxy-L-arabinose transferase-like glycosyltransferase
MMLTERSAGPQAFPGRPWWREAEVAGLIALVLAAYFVRLGALPIRGEGSTRAQIAREMVERGDWLVPRQQGEPFRIRPPLQNWLIACSSLAFGRWDTFTVRFPSALATLLTTLLVYGYSRTFLSRTGALAAGAAFATFADQFQMGRQAETEAVFILLVSASLLTWHWGLTRRWPDAQTWAAGYVLMALAALTKSVQAPAYFLGGVGAYLVLAGEWRRLLSRAHLLGALAGAAVLGAWVIPYYRLMGWSGVHDAWLGDCAARIENYLSLREFLLHLFTFPPEVAAGTLPWSLLLLLYLSRDFRASIRDARPQVLFLATCLAVAFPTCWLHPGGRPRFFAPLYPCLAVLVGLVVQRCGEAAAGVALRAAWGRYLVTVAGVLIALAVAVAGAAAARALRPALSDWGEPPLAALAYVAALVGLAVVIFRAREGGSPARTRSAVLAVAASLAVLFPGVANGIRLRRSEDPVAAMRRLKEQLPPGQALVSFDRYLDSLFPFYYGLPLVTPRPWPVAGGDYRDVTYFCVQCQPGDSRPELPFAWKEVGVIPLDRNRHRVPEGVVVVGLRLPEESVTTARR